MEAMLKSVVNPHNTSYSSAGLLGWCGGVLLEASRLISVTWIISMIIDGC